MDSWAEEQALMWSEFLDLCAYAEDPSGLGGDASDMDHCARVCLYMIAERLVRAIADDYKPADDDAAGARCPACGDDCPDDDGMVCEDCRLTDCQACGATMRACLINCRACGEEL